MNKIIINIIIFDIQNISKKYIGSPFTKLIKFKLKFDLYNLIKYKEYIIDFKILKYSDIIENITFNNQNYMVNIIFTDYLTNLYNKTIGE